MANKKWSAYSLLTAAEAAAVDFIAINDVSVAAALQNKAIVVSELATLVFNQTVTNTANKTFNNTTLLLRNVADTFNGSFVNTNTVDRIYTLQDAAGTLAFVTRTIAGITGTKAQFNTAVTDGNILYDGVAALANLSDVVSATNTDKFALMANGTTGYVGRALVKADISDLGTVGDMLLGTVQTNTAAKTFNNTTFLLRNVANTFNGSFVNTNTADRIYTLQNAAGTLAFLSDITGTNSGTNTGDQTSIVGITGTKAQFNTAVTDGNILYDGVAALSNLSDVVSATNTDKFALMANGTTGYVGRALVEADISDLQTYALLTANTFTALQTIRLVGKQLSLENDASNHTAFTTDSGGDLTITPSGGNIKLDGDVTIDPVGAGGGLLFDNSGSSTRLFSGETIVYQSNANPAHQFTSPGFTNTFVKFDSTSQGSGSIPFVIDNNTHVDFFKASIEASGARVACSTATILDSKGLFLESTVTTFADDATPTVAAGNLFKTSGTTAITDFDLGVVGQTIYILAESSVTITNNAAIILKSGANVNMVSGDTMVLTMFNDQIWQEI